MEKTIKFLEQKRDEIVNNLLSVKTDKKYRQSLTITQRFDMIREKDSINTVIKILKKEVKENG